ncbi:MAG: 2Fe-2S iron-sulfur cluster-binding protein [Nitrococcus sp.]|nr:2Fe-2S iron-sulfur cluster-binding protein [Nitrococcus sp.]
MRQHRVTLRNRAYATLLVKEDQSILDAFEASGFILPVGCRYGGCITCAARKISGSVRQPKATALNKRQSALGYVLLCVARPTEGGLRIRHRRRKPRGTLCESIRRRLGARHAGEDRAEMRAVATSEKSTRARVIPVVVKAAPES